MAEFTETLRRKYGPLTGWQWGLVAVAGATTLVLVRRYRAAQAAAEEAAPGADASKNVPVLVPYRGEMPFDAANPVPGPGVLQPIHDSQQPEGFDPEASNLEWLAQATAAVYARSQAGGGDLTNTSNWTQQRIAAGLQRYLDGNPRIPNDLRIIRTAIDEVGRPPRGTPNV